MFEAVVFRVGFAVDDRFLGECIADGCLQRVGNDLLSVVVIDLDGVVRLESVEVCQQIVRQVSPQLSLETTFVVVELAFAVCERHVGEGQIPCEGEERDEQALAVGHAEGLVVGVPVEQWSCVEGNVWQ